MFNFHHLHYFWSVAREQNLTRAAEKLHVSQSAVSTQIRKLEDELGQPLFTRSGKRLVLTEAGRIAYEHAEAIFAHGRELETALSGGSGAREVLRVGSMATLSRNFQLGFLRPILRRPDVELVVRSGALGELLRLLSAHLLDVVLTNLAPPVDAGASTLIHALAKQRVCLVGAPRRGRRPTALSALIASEPLVLPTADSSIRTGFDALAAELGARPRIAAEVDDMAMLRLFAREKMGLALVPSIVVADELRARTLVEVARLPLHEVFYAVTVRRRFPNALLADLLKRRAAKA
jgi:LysR family transcriptional activator of nhaA